MAAQSLYILDGMALMYRAFYAFINSPMRNSEGLNTSAMFGFANTLLSLIEKQKPTHLVACLDSSGPSFRNEQYAAYKANRQAMPEELRASIPFIIEILEAMRIPILREKGFEADDLIGTVTRVADASADLHSYIVSLDKDLGQLLSPRCSFWRPGRKGEEFELIDEPAFLSKWGIERPMQIVDILALMGDASDNIPGVPGVGEVTAKKLITQFGSVSEIIARSAELKGKLREKLEGNVDSLELSYKLATIHREVPVEFSVESVLWQGFDREKLVALFERLEFRGLVKRFGGSGTVPAAAPATVPSGEAVQMELFDTPALKCLDDRPHDYQILTQPQQHEALAARLLKASHWAFDTETTGLDPLRHKLIGMSFCLKEGEAFYVPLPLDATEAEREAILAPFRAPLMGKSEKWGCNLKFDWQVMRAAGVDMCGPYVDAMLAHCLLHPDRRHSMDEMAETLLRYQCIKLTDIAGKDCETALVPVEVMGRYAAEDAEVTLRLCELLQEQLKREGQLSLMRKMEYPLLEVLASIEATGMMVEPSILSEASEALGLKIDALREGINQQIGREINLNSPKQLGELLFGELKIVDKPKKTRTGQFVTDEETLRKLVPTCPLVKDILDYRELAKLKGTYLDALPRHISEVDGRIHASLMQMVTATGRLACQNPNLQNIPVRSEEGKLIRRAFVASGEEFSILSADYSQVELRLMAALSGDEAMIAAFKEGRDIHTETAARIYGIAHNEVSPEQRRAAKTVNFGIIYGISAFGLSQRIDCSRYEAAQLIENYFAQFPSVKSFMDNLVDEARQRGYASTIQGRHRQLPDLSSANFNLRAAAERTAINTPIQGSAADMIKLAMLKVHELLRGKKSRLIMQVHDELLFELHRDEKAQLVPQIVEAMQLAMPLPKGVPLEVEAQDAPNWLEAH